jgi:hypothetical protein
VRRFIAAFPSALAARVPLLACPAVFSAFSKLLPFVAFCCHGDAINPTRQPRASSRFYMNTFILHDPAKNVIAPPDFCIRGAREARNPKRRQIGAVGSRFELLNFEL